jgi:hypothetical protein
MAVFFPPPPPFMGGRQPHAGIPLAPAIIAIRVDNPPFTDGGPVPLPAAIVSIAQPNPWTYSFMGARQPYGSKQLSPAIPGQSLDQPVAIQPGRTPVALSIAATWQPDPWTFAFQGRQPYEPRRLSPGVPGMSADPPPVTLGGPIALKMEMVAVAQPDPWVYTFHTRNGVSAQPYGARSISPAIPGQSTDPPPFALGGPGVLKMEMVAVNQIDWSVIAWPYLFLGNRQPYAPRLLPAASGAVAVSSVPSTHRERTAIFQAIRAAWNPPPFNEQFQMKMYASSIGPPRLRPSARGYIIL